MKIKDKVRINVPMHRFFHNRVGIIIAIGKVGRRKEYIVQLTNPIEWSYFKRSELKWDKITDKKKENSNGQERKNTDCNQAGKDVEIRLN